MAGDPLGIDLFANKVGLQQGQQSRRDMENEMKRRLLMRRAEEIADRNPEMLHRALNGGGPPAPRVGGGGSMGGGPSSPGSSFDWQGIPSTAPDPTGVFATPGQKEAGAAGVREGAEYERKLKMQAISDRFKIGQADMADDAARSAAYKATIEDPAEAAQARALELASARGAGKADPLADDLMRAGTAAMERARKLRVNPLTGAPQSDPVLIREADDAEKMAMDFYQRAQAAKSAPAIPTGPKRLAFPPEGDWSEDEPAPPAADWRSQVTQLRAPAVYPPVSPDSPFAANLPAMTPNTPNTPNTPSAADPIGTRKVKGGVVYEKTPQGWVPVQ